MMPTLEESLGYKGGKGAIQEMIDDAVAAERERIAQVIERLDNTMMNQDKLAKHIRARGTE
jgi:ppGpp synthetase/RelA/SpoT-type nucleotidyltranferase